MILTQLLLGSAVIAFSIGLQALIMSVVFRALKSWRKHLRAESSMWRMTGSIVLATLAMLANLAGSIWIWAGMFMLMQIFGTMEESVYFSIVAFTTLGFGDIVLPQPWRVLSGLVATNGVIHFGLTTAFLIEVLGQINRGPNPQD